jgi:hypothetical protein
MGHMRNQPIGPLPKEGTRDGALHHLGPVIKQETWHEHPFLFGGDISGSRVYFY